MKSKPKVFKSFAYDQEMFFNKTKFICSKSGAETLRF